MTTLPRVVSLISSATEILFGLGLGDHVVGISHECDHPPEVAQRPRVTRSHIRTEQSSQQIDDQVRQTAAVGEPLYEIDASRLIELAPDVIVTQAQCDVCAVRYDDVVNVVQSNDALAHATILTLNPCTLEDVFADILMIGDATRRRTAAAAYVDRLRNRVEAVRRQASQYPNAERPRVTCVEWVQPLMLAGNWIPELVRLAGGQCQLDEECGPSQYHDWLELLRFDPQVVVVMPCGFDLARARAESQSLTTQPKWKELTAAKESRVFAVDGNAYFNRSGPRLVDSLEILAHLFHPQSIPPPAINQQEQLWSCIDG